MLALCKCMYANPSPRNNASQKTQVGRSKVTHISKAKGPTADLALNLHKRVILTCTLTALSVATFGTYDFYTNTRPSLNVMDRM